jgi:putative salt-induced outer membrane protein YdiY
MRGWTSSRGVYAACLLGICLSAGGQEAAPADKLSVGLNFGLTLTEGNSDTMECNTALLMEAEWPQLGALRAGAEARYGESRVEGRRDTTVDNARAFSNARRNLSERTFVSVDVTAMYDEVAEVDYRATLGPGLGAYLIKRETTELSIEAGLSYLWEKKEGSRGDYPVARFGERFSHVLSPTSRVCQSLDVLPKAEDFTEFLLNAEVGVEAALNSRLNVRVVVQAAHDSDPAEEVEKTDLSVIAGLGVKLH